jgi:hypothetical protein
MAKTKLIYSTLSLLIIAIVYFIIYKNFIKPKKTGCVKTIIKHKDGKILEKNSFEETINSPETGVFIFCIFIILVFVLIKKFIFANQVSFSTTNNDPINIDITSSLP